MIGAGTARASLKRRFIHIKLAIFFVFVQYKISLDNPSGRLYCYKTSTFTIFEMVEEVWLIYAMWYNHRNYKAVPKKTSFAIQLYAFLYRIAGQCRKEDSVPTLNHHEWSYYDRKL